MKRLILAITLALISTCMLFADNNATELTDDSIIALVAEEEFNMDDYQAQLESLAGDDYKKYKALQERMGVSKEQREAAEKAKKQRLWLRFILSLVVALIPIFDILRQVITGEIQPAGPAAIFKTAGVLLGWGIVLFGLNFAWMWVLFTGNTKIMGAILGLALLAFVVYAAVSVNKYYKKLNNRDKN